MLSEEMHRGQQILQNGLDIPVDIVRVDNKSPLTFGTDETLRVRALFKKLQTLNYMIKYIFTII